MENSERTTDESSDLSPPIEAETHPATTEAETSEEESQTLPTGLNSGIASALKSDLKAQIEAVLFVTDKPLKTGAISKMLNIAYDEVQSAIVQLIQEYEDRSGGLEIGTEEGYIIQVKVDYLSIVTEMLPLELNPGPLRTLSAIALKEPALQSQVVDMRGSGAYEHINELVEQDLITKTPQGLSYILKTTNKFKQYFRLSKEGDLIKQKLQEEASKLAKEKAERKKAEEEAKLQEVPAIEGQEASS